MTVWKEGRGKERRRESKREGGRKGSNLSHL
jgi:hypothetical protein